MKTLADILALSIAFWMAAAKLILAIHPIAATEDDQPVVEQSDTESEYNQKVVSAVTLARQSESDDASKKSSLGMQLDAANDQIKQLTASLATEKQRADSSASAAVSAKAETAKRGDEVQKLREQLAAIHAEAKKLDDASAEASRKQADEIKNLQEQLEQRDKEKAEAESAAKKAARNARPAEPPLPKVSSKEINWLKSLTVGREQSKATGKKIVIDFETENCGPCRAVSEMIKGSPEIIQTINSEYTPVWLYSTEYDNNHRSEFRTEKDKHKHTLGFPLIVVEKPDGTWDSFTPYVDPDRTQKQNEEDFLNQLKNLGVLS